MNMHLSYIAFSLATAVVSMAACDQRSQVVPNSESLFDTPLSAEADAFLTSCNIEYNEKQKEFHERFLGDVESYHADLESGVISFHKASGAVPEFDTQVVGSVSRSAQTWEWAWHNPNVASALSRASEQVKPLGDKYNLRYLTTGFVPIPNEHFPAYLSGIALKVSGSLAVYAAEYEDLEIYLLLSNPRESEP